MTRAQWFCVTLFTSAEVLIKVNKKVLFILSICVPFYKLSAE